MISENRMAPARLVARMGTHIHNHTVPGRKPHPRPCPSSPFCVNKRTESIDRHDSTTLAYFKWLWHRDANSMRNCSSPGASQPRAITLVNLSKTYHRFKSAVRGNSRILNPISTELNPSKPLGGAYRISQCFSCPLIPTKDGQDLFHEMVSIIMAAIIYHRLQRLD